MVLACPECEDSNIIRRAGGTNTAEVHHSKKWYCRECTAEFPAPCTRDSNSVCPDAEPRRGLSKDLLDADADEVFSQ